jgi:hypothetical protein
MKRLLVAVLMLAGISLTCCKAKTTDWILVSKQPSLHLYVERNSIEHVSGNTVRAWFTYVFTNPKAIGSKFIKKGLTYDEINCDRKTLQIIRVTFFLTDGTSESLTEKSAVTDIKPGSMSEVEYSYLCQGRQEKPK